MHAVDGASGESTRVSETTANKKTVRRQIRLSSRLREGFLKELIVADDWLAAVEVFVQPSSFVYSYASRARLKTARFRGEKSWEIV